MVVLAPLVEVVFGMVAFIGGVVRSGVAAHPEPDSQWPFQSDSLRTGQPSIMEPAPDLGIAETRMHMGVSITQGFARVGRKIHNQQAATGTQDARRLSDGGSGVLYRM
jgi:hypothetical protein